MNASMNLEKNEVVRSGRPLPSQWTPEQLLKRQRRGRLIMLALLLVCAAPVIASYLTYYVIRPEGRTNYGTLVNPLRDVSQLSGQALDGTQAGIAQFRGKWLLLTGSDAVCEANCEHRLYLMRQLRLTTGKDRDRVERVWIVPPGTQPGAELLREHEGLKVIRSADDALQAAGFAAEAGARPQDHVWIVDPLGNLVLRYPASPDPNKMKKDLHKLLRASRIG
jgi:hypothetical protein